MSPNMVTFDFLKNRFLSNLVGRLDEMRKCIESPAPDSDRLYRMFHSLAGIGGTYGYPEITELARVGEAICNNGGRNGLHEIVGGIATAAGIRERKAA